MKTLKNTFKALATIIIVVCCILIAYVQLSEPKQEKVIKDTILVQSTRKCVISREYVLFNTGVAIPDNFPDNYIDTIINCCHKYNVPDSIVFRLIWVESRFSLKKTNRYTPLFQITNHIVRFIDKKIKFNCKDSTVKEINIGIWYLSYLYDKYGRWDLVLSEYNSGHIKDSCGVKVVSPASRKYVSRIINWKKGIYKLKIVKP